MRAILHRTLKNVTRSGPDRIYDRSCMYRYVPGSHLYRYVSRHTAFREMTQVISSSPSQRVRRLAFEDGVWLELCGNTGARRGRLWCGGPAPQWCRQALQGICRHGRCCEARWLQKARSSPSGDLQEHARPRCCSTVRHRKCWRAILKGAGVGGGVLVQLAGHHGRSCKRELY